MFVIGIIGGPYFLQGRSYSIVEVWGRIINIVQVRNIEFSLPVINHFGSHIVNIPGGEERAGMAGYASPVFGNDLAVIGHGAFKDLLAVTLGFCQFRTQGPVTVGGPGNGSNITVQGGQLFRCEGLNTREKYREPWPALPLQGGIGPFPFKRGGIENPPEGAVINRADTDSVRFNVVG